MICLGLDEGESFWCAGNLYSMLIPRDNTHCLEAVVETIEPGKSTPGNAHDTFVQLYIIIQGSARVHLEESFKEIASPAVAFIPRKAQHYVENIGKTPLKYIYVSIWPGEIPVEEGLTWRVACARMIEAYEAQGYGAEPIITPVSATSNALSKSVGQEKKHGIAKNPAVEHSPQ